MTASNTVVFIVADEKYNAGERDYAKAIVAQIRAQGLNDDTEYLFYKIQPKGQEAAQAALAKGGDPRILPGTDAEYAAVPAITTITTAVLDQLDKTKNPKIIGVGHSTLDTVVKLSLWSPVRTDPSYITHMVDDRAQLQRIVNNGVRLFASTTQEKLDEISPSLAAQVKFTPLDAVPHTNSLASCEAEYAAFLSKSPNGPEVKRIVESGKPFAFAVINAGFEVGPDKKYTPYTEEEAWIHGASLAYALPRGTHLIAAHGGPRNLRDETPSAEKGDTHKPQKTLEAFVEGYSNVQRNRSIVVCERFEQGLPYNAIKAGYITGRKPNCRAFIPNSEGYGTMDGAVLHIDNQNKILGMFSFDAQNLDPTGQRLKNIEKYNKLGVSVLRPILDERIKVEIDRHPEEKKTPYPTQDGAEIIVQSLGLAQLQPYPVNSRPHPRGIPSSLER